MFLCAIGCGFLMFVATDAQDTTPASVLNLAVSKVSPKMLALCDIKTTWSTAAKKQLTYEHKTSKHIEIRGIVEGGLTCGGFSTPLCSTSLDGQMVCRCNADLRALKRTPLKPSKKKAKSKTRLSYGDVLAYWSSKDAKPKWFVLNDEPGPEKIDLNVVSHDLNGDGHPEVLIAVDGVYNTIGRRWIHTVVFDARRPKTAHKHDTLAPQVFDHEGRLTPSHCKTSSCDQWRNPIQAIMIRQPGQLDARKCALMSMSMSTTGNFCNGCTAGGATQSTYDAKLYKKNGKWVVQPSRRLW